MKRLTLGTLAATVLVVAVALSNNQKPTSINGLQVQMEERNPWTNLRLNNAAETFHFAVVSDRTGGHRARIFSQAIDQLNLLQPAFVISVGDLIEGYTKESAKLSGEWKEFQSFACKLQMPFFYVPGNHDVSNEYQEKDWQERFGRRYYHFVYRDVLFLMLCSEDPAPGGDTGGVSKEQIAFVEKTLKENAGVRWTIVALHRPLWTYRAAENGWLEVEKLLAGRPYTVFAGHIHVFQKFVRQGMNYYQLATTGGASRLRGVKYGEFDHITWVTMKKDGPILANLMLDGIYTENMKQPISAEEGVAYNRKPVHKVGGKVFYEGTPTPDARVVFHLIQGKRTTRVADAIVEADGSFALTTYHAFDGAPAGSYAVTVTWREPGVNGRPAPNRLPEKYAKAETSELRVEVKGKTNVVLSLSP
jgi:hypothetical protein